MTVDNDTAAHDTDSPLDETILTLLEEHKVLPTAGVAEETNISAETIDDHLQMMATVGLIEHRETANGDVWLTW